MEEPTILTVSTYNWKPALSASSRHSNAKRRRDEVSEYFKSLGFEVIVNGNDSISATHGDVEVLFSYNESCTNVYKRFSVTKGGKTSNITGLRSYLAKKQQ